MSVESTLLKVDADLRGGRIPVARQRLRGLASSYPADLTVRRRLAEVYRLYGEPVEAGRWAYLEEHRDLEETAAFEARYPDPRVRMGAVRWYGSERLVEAETARARLAGLREAASAHAGRPVYWHTIGELAPSGDQEASLGDSDWLFITVFALVVLAVLGFAVLGVITMVRWLL
ncbi:DUF6584 family protein [Kitasatospora sp. NPDC057223]|uniref:DUF6584 family protein n=1 Tax=Kitasatospora sp. NPDC057223 TaxID=3346055 RepID=UPI0036376659